jgi:hypothetical protein
MVPENKQNEYTNKLTTLDFKMIPILHNTLLATTKLKIYSVVFANFWGPANPATTIVMDPKENCTLVEFVLFGSLLNSKFFQFLAPNGVFAIQGLNTKFYCGAFILLG